MENNFSRVGDDSYSFYVQGKDKDIEIVIDSKLHETHQKIYEISKKIADTLTNLDNKELVLNKNKEVYVKVDNAVFVLEPVGPSKFNVSKFTKNIQNKNLIRYNLELYSPAPESPESSKVPASPLPSLPLNQQLTSRENFEKIVESNLFSDPYTSLSTLAFQKYEPYYICHDPVKKNDFSSQYAILEKKGKLSLVKQSEELEPKEVEQTFNGYLQFLVKMYGSEKIKYIEKCYGLNLKPPLTPELVYKINIGLGNIEIQDVKSIAQKLKKLKKKLDVNLITKESAIDTLISKSDEVGLSIFEIRGIYKALSSNNKEPTSEDLINWLSDFDFKNPIEKVSLKQFDAFVNLLSITDEERESQYTGRKIDKPIQSDYTTAGKNVFKPWVDQQELLQIFPSLKNHGWENYYEKLCHVVCKKHLARVHPQENYRVGALIPAPNDKNGNAQWYKVAQFVNNGYGIVSYLLLPASEQYELPAIKLYRSTASDRSAMDGQASAMNDINPINPPGYQGSYLSEHLEGDFFNDRSIPVWVGYQQQAELQLQSLNLKDVSSLDKIFKNLESATKELQFLEAQKENSLSLIGIIKKYDAAFLELLKQVHLAEKKTKELPLNVLSVEFNRKENINNVKHLISILTENEENQSPKEDKESAKFILHLMEDLHDFNGKDLIEKALKKEILKLPETQLESESSGSSSKESFDSEDSNSKQDISEKELLIIESNSKEEAYLEGSESEKKSDDIKHEVTSNQIINSFQELENIFYSESPDQKKVIKLLKRLNKQLFRLSKSLKEDINSKIPQPIVLAGHSLGGACAQRGFVQHIIDKRRIPLPGQKVSLRLFAEPGIRHDDNESFKNFGNSHSDLLQNQDSRFSIFRRQTEGDFVVAGGEEHLGATSFKEEEEVLKWMEFNACIQSPHSEVEERSLASTSITHAMQFETSKKGLSSSTLKAVEEFSEPKESSNLTKEQNLERNKRWTKKVKKVKKIAKEYVGDHQKKWYSPSIQGSFDLSSKVKNENHRKFIEQAWNLTVGSEKGEKIRKWTGLKLQTVKLFNNVVNNALSSSEEESKLHGNWKDLCDSQGVFAVDEKGVITK